MTRCCRTAGSDGLNGGVTGSFSKANCAPHQTRASRQHLARMHTLNESTSAWHFFRSGDLAANAVFSSLRILVASDIETTIRNSGGDPKNFRCRGSPGNPDVRRVPLFVGNLDKDVFRQWICICADMGRDREKRFTGAGRAGR